MNNRRRWLFAQQARWFTSQFDADAITQRARIVADGGEVIDFNAMQSFIRGLKDLGLYDNLLACWDVRFGVKKDGSGSVSRWYDISANNRDAAQATGSIQPLFNSNLGVDYITTTGTQFFNIPETTVYEHTFIAKTRLNDYSTRRPLIGDEEWFAWIRNDTLTYYVSKSVTNYLYGSYAITPAEWLYLSHSFPDGVISNVRRSYVDFIAKGTSLGTSIPVVFDRLLGGRGYVYHGDVQKMLLFNIELSASLQSQVCAL